MLPKSFSKKFIVELIIEFKRNSLVYVTNSLVARPDIITAVALMVVVR